MLLLLSSRSRPALAATIAKSGDCFLSLAATATAAAVTRAPVATVARFSTTTSGGLQNNNSATPSNHAADLSKAAAAAVVASVAAAKLGHCENETASSAHSAQSSPAIITATSSSSSEDDEDLELPTYTMSQVSRYNGSPNSDNGNQRIWMTYAGFVYDVTDFIANHPGGSEKIKMGAGGPIEPYWYLYRQHYASDLPISLLSKMKIGKLHPSDQELIDEQMENVTEQTPDPYENEPIRNSTLIVHGDTPMNAEVPQESITDSYCTPNDLFYIRHHHPVPFLTEEDVREFTLDVDLTILFPEVWERRGTKGRGENGNKGGVLMTNRAMTTGTTTSTAVDIVRRATTDTNTSSSSSSSSSNSVIAKLSLEQIKSLPKVELTSTLQCSGNRRGGFNDLRQTSGTPWGQGAISTAKWGGARLIDVLMLAMDEALKKKKEDGDVAASPDGGNGAKKNKMTKKKGKRKSQHDDGKKEPSLIETLHHLQRLIDAHPELQHLRFESLDGMLASIDANKGLNPFGDVILAYEMNGEDLPRDHGYPLRVIVPGYAAVRNVKWLKKLELAEEEALGTWQRGLNYKILPPTVLDAKEVDLDDMPGLSEECVFSGITKVENLSHNVIPKYNNTATKTLTPGETVLVKASGWAYAGGGRNVVRVDVTGNNGKSWQTATITQGSNQPFRRAWAWVFWECDVPAIVCEDGVSVELACKGVDMAFNTQPESMGGMWNVRGLVNNSYYRVKHTVM